MNSELRRRLKLLWFINKPTICGLLISIVLMQFDPGESFTIHRTIYAVIFSVVMILYFISIRRFWRNRKILNSEVFK